MRILSADPALPYAKPPLSKDYLCGRRANLDLHSAGWFERNDVDLIRGVTVDRIDVEAREVITAGGVHYPYWHLVLAPGSAAVPLAVPGVDLGGRRIIKKKTVRLKMAARHAETAVVVGAGLIGCEAAACLAGLGVATTIVAPEIVPLQRRFGVDVGERIVKMLSDAGVRFIGASSVAAVEDAGVLLASGETVDGDVVVAATGVRPDIRLATAAGLATEDGRIVVDEHMRTSDRSIYAAGDVTLACNVAAGRSVVSEHWRDAAQQGLVAGLTAAGFPQSWNRVSEFTCKIGKFTLTYHGWSPPYDSCNVTDRRNGFSATYECGGGIVGTLDATTSPAS